VTDYLLDVSSMLVRWLHLIAGIAWIGASFYFVWLDNHLDPSPEEGVAGELWSVHGGGFYNKRKFLVAPARLPARLHWFKWEAYWTWISGFTLLVLVYYVHPDRYLVRPDGPLSGVGAVALSLVLVAVSYLVYDLVCRSPLGHNGPALALAVLVAACLTEWALAKVYSGRGAYIQVGAMLGTMMAANVLMVIIPGQRRMVAAMLAGRTPNPDDGRRGKQRSMHNNYLTLPVLFVMISNHYPRTYGDARAWAVFGVFTAAGMLIRHFVNLRQRGRIVATPLVLAVALLLGLIIALAPPVSLRVQAGPAGGPVPATATVGFATAEAIVTERCAPCHALHPTRQGYSAPPGGVRLDQAASIRARAADIRAQVASGAMPLGNATGMTAAERAALVAWAGG
jgi:uncharacterized membrane protein